MELNINISIRLEQSPALTHLLRAMNPNAIQTGGATPQSLETIKPLIEIDMEEVAKAVKKAIKESPIELKAEAVEEKVAASLAQPIALEPAPAKTRSLEEIKSLATNMAAHQDFNTLKFLTDAGYKRMSQIPEAEYDNVYNALKKQEVPF